MSVQGGIRAVAEAIYDTSRTVVGAVGGSKIQSWRGCVLRGVAKHPTAGSWCGREAAVWTCGGGVEARWKGGGVPVGDGARSDGGLCQPQRQNLADQTLVLVALSHNQVPHHVPQRMIRIELQTIWKDNSEEFSRIRGASSCESVESASHASATFPLGGCLIDQTTLPTQRGARSASSGSHKWPASENVAEKCGRRKVPATR